MNTATAAYNLCIQAATMNDAVTTSSNSCQLGPVGSVILLAIAAIVMFGIAIATVIVCKDLCD